MQQETETARLLSTEYPSSTWIANLNPNWEQHYTVLEFPEYDTVDVFFGELVRFVEGNLEHATAEVWRDAGLEELWHMGEELLMPILGEVDSAGNIL